MIKQDGKMFRVLDASGRDTGKYGMSMEKALQIEAKLGIKSGGSAPSARFVEGDEVYPAPRRQKAPQPSAPGARFVDGDEVYPAPRRHPQASVGLRFAHEYDPNAMHHDINHETFWRPKQPATSAAKRAAQRLTVDRTRSRKNPRAVRR